MRRQKGTVEGRDFDKCSRCDTIVQPALGTGHVPTCTHCKFTADYRGRVVRRTDIREPMLDEIEWGGRMIQRLREQVR